MIFFFVRSWDNRLTELWIFIFLDSFWLNRLLIFKFLHVSIVHGTIEVGNNIAYGEVVKPLMCVYFLNLDLKNQESILMDFKRMDEVKGVHVAYGFDSA